MMQYYINEYIWVPLVLVLIYLIRYIITARKIQPYVIYDYKDETRVAVPALRTKTGVSFSVGGLDYEAETSTAGKFRKEGRFLPRSYIEWHVLEGQETFTTNTIGHREWTPVDREERRKNASYSKYGKFLDAGMAQFKRAPLWILILAAFTGMWIQSMIDIVITLISQGEAG